MYVCVSMAGEIPITCALRRHISVIAYMKEDEEDEEEGTSALRLE